MALVRMTEKKLAANRANAQFCRGPATPEGKERSSRNACKHRLYAKKHQLPPEWQARIWSVVEPCLVGVEDPLERAATLHYAVLCHWVIELIAYESRLFDESIARHRSINRGVHDFAVHNPLFLAIEARRHALFVQVQRARSAWLKARKRISLQRTNPQTIEKTPLTEQPKTLTMAAAAGSTTPIPIASASRPRPFNFLISRPQAVPQNHFPPPRPRPPTLSTTFQWRSHTKHY